jgi:hypothetical protein
MKLAQAVITKEPLAVIKSDVEERTVTVIRDGKRVKKELVKKPVRKKIRTAKQKAGARKAAVKRKVQQGAINRKRAKSVKKRTGLKKQSNSKFKVREGMKLATQVIGMVTDLIINEKRKYAHTDLPDLVPGKVRVYDAKRFKGAIEGPDGVLFDIDLNASDKEHVAWGSRIKKGMKIKFKIVDDPDFDQAIIGDFSF